MISGITLFDCSFNKIKKEDFFIELDIVVGVRTLKICSLFILTNQYSRDDLSRLWSRLRDLN